MLLCIGVRSVSCALKFLLFRHLFSSAFLPHGVGYEAQFRGKVKMVSGGKGNFLAQGYSCISILGVIQVTVETFCKDRRRFTTIKSYDNVRSCLQHRFPSPSANDLARSATTAASGLLHGMIGARSSPSVPGASVPLLSTLQFPTLILMPPLTSGQCLRFQTHLLSFFVQFLLLLTALFSFLLAPALDFFNAGLRDYVNQKNF